MNAQLVIVGLCLLVAVAFIIKKVFSTLMRKGPPSCGGCPNEKACASNQAIRPPCSLREIKPAKRS